MSQLPTPVSRRRIILKHVLVNVVLVVLLVLLGAWCYSEGKTYKITLGNSAFTCIDVQRNLIFLCQSLYPFIRR